MCDIRNALRAGRTAVSVKTGTLVAAKRRPSRVRNVCYRGPTLWRRRLNVKKPYGEAQIIKFLRAAESGVAVKDLCRRHGIAEASFHL